MLQTGRSVQLSNIPADLSAFVRSETTGTIERNSFEIPARVKKDPILNNYLTQTMESSVPGRRVTLPETFRLQRRAILNPLEREPTCF